MVKQIGGQQRFELSFINQHHPIHLNALHCADIGQLIPGIFGLGGCCHAHHLRLLLNLVINHQLLDSYLRIFYILS